MLTLASGSESFSDESLEPQHRLVELRETGWTPRNPAGETLGDKKKQKNVTFPVSLDLSTSL